jgi:hypothetical protein
MQFRHIFPKKEYKFSFIVFFSRLFIYIFKKLREKLLFKKNMNRFKPIFIILLILCIPSLGLSWELSLNKDGIKVFTRKTDFSSVKEFRAETIIKSPLSTLIAIIDDVPFGPHWIPNNKVNKVIKKISPTEKYIYSIYQTPWPFKNRDLVNFQYIVQDKNDKSVTINAKGAPSFVPLKEDLVRIPKSKGFWKLIPLKDGYVKVIQQGAGEPGGNAPSWVINIFIIDGPYKTCLNLMSLVNNDKYKNARLDYIEN